jgi:uncharacterized Zn-binding protein involved in type VI secretion
MPAATRIGDQCTGHEHFPPRINDSGSSNVFINSMGAHRVGDHWVEHSYDDNTHDSVLLTGSSTVFVNGMPAARIGDLIACGSAVSQGSPNVFIG